jgi:nucleotide-binding universal stress UspA family protein
MKSAKILVGVDFSEIAQAALKVAANLAKRMSGSLVLVHVGDVVTSGRESRLATVRHWEELLKDRLEGERQKLEAMREDLGIPSRLVRVDGSPAEELARLAKEEDADLVVVGTHGRTGAKKVVFGSVAQETVRRCSCDVLVVREGAPLTHNHILVPVDFSEHTEPAIERALSVVEEGGRIELVHFWIPPWGMAPGDGPSTQPEIYAELMDEQQQQIEAEGESLVSKYDREGIELRFEAARGEPVPGLAERVESGSFDLIVMGSHGRRGFRRFFIGSVAENVVVHAGCTTLVVHK